MFGVLIHVKEPPTTGEQCRQKYDNPKRGKFGHEQFGDDVREIQQERTYQFQCCILAGGHEARQQVSVSCLAEFLHPQSERKSTTSIQRR